MSLPATDSFNRADGAIGANWTAVDGGFDVVSNQIAGNTLQTNLGYWSADVFQDDQYAQVVVGVGPSPDGSPATRIASLRGYILSADASKVHLYRIDANESFALLQSNSGTGVSAADVLRLESEGSTHRVYKNAGQLGTDQNDGTYAAGSAGMFIYATAPRLDDWEGGNLGIVRRWILGTH
jgi:hypothetical protein